MTVGDKIRKIRTFRGIGARNEVYVVVGKLFRQIVGRYQTSAEIVGVA